MSKNELKEEIVAVYGYERIYAVPTVSHVDKLKYSDEQRQSEDNRKKKEAVKFAEILEKSLATNNNEIHCTTHTYGKTGAYQEFLYFTREYRQ